MIINWRAFVVNLPAIIAVIKGQRFYHKDTKSTDVHRELRYTAVRNSICYSKFFNSYMQKSGVDIRLKLYNFIRLANDKKLAVLYHLFKDDIDESQAWWKDKVYTKELKSRFEDLEIGIDKGVTPDQLEATISKLRAKKYA